MANDGGQGSKSNGRKSGMNIDTALVRELAEMLNETGLTEIEVEDDDRKIR
ncbi:MAG TPA: acetyl-CoA carboxylase, biotin carboxyl carrier protein, partial [Erythrobacter sp.]|nr:acetyl-CoA carboxylase, biotin carboxyl carrier protein [Erythrobacter sp.]